MAESWDDAAAHIEDACGEFTPAMSDALAYYYKRPAA
jgi:hypothetical protein